MIKETIIISDANILFDIVAAGLIDEFFELPGEKWTSSFVFNEIETTKEMHIIYEKIKRKALHKKDFEFGEIIEINDLRNAIGYATISITDCSVWFMTRKLQGRLLTGDRKLRSVVEADGLKVSGILFVFDNIIDYGILKPSEAAKRLSRLMQTNTRLPFEECNKRLNLWKTL
ncbi:MAG: hypothetical protein J5800_06760 [Spirochaetales bacterium]|nr:hypothetical protein [Spirochaetales bacterium]